MIEETSDSPFPASSGLAGGTGTASGPASSTGVGNPGLAGSGLGAGLGGSSTATGGMTGRGAPPLEGSVHRMAQKAHEAVDRLEQTLDAGSERMQDWQQEYGDMAREQVRASPLAALGVAFGVGVLFSRLFMR